MPWHSEAMAYSCFDVDIADQVAHVRLSRPVRLLHPRRPPARRNRVSV